MDISAGEVLELADWRRRVFDTYRTARLEPDPSAAWRQWRLARDDLFGNHSQSPIPTEARTGFPGLCYFDYDPAARVLASLDDPDTDTWTFEAGEGTLTLDCFAVASFRLYGMPQKLRLYWIRAYAGGIFLSFRDATSGRLTYGGCRYLLDSVKGADLGSVGDEVVLDFNFAYQPSCAYDPRWICPLAPAFNRMDVEVLAGERSGQPAK